MHPEKTRAVRLTSIRFFRNARAASNKHDAKTFAAVFASKAGDSKPRRPAESGTGTIANKFIKPIEPQS
jgi:hypothetical protein